MDAGYVDFKADLGAWKTNQKVPISNDFSSIKDAWLIAHATSGLDEMLETALRTVTRLNELDQAIEEAGVGNAGADALTILSTRKVGKIITSLSEKEGWQAKEKKEIQEMLRLYAARKIFSKMGVDLNYGLPSKNKRVGAFTSGGVQFIANYGAWKCVKKFRVEETTNRRTVAELITSYAITLDLRFEEYLRELGNISTLDGVLQKAPGKDAQLVHVMQFLNGNEVKGAIQKTSSGAGFPEYADVLRAYAIRKVLKARGIIIDYTQIKSLPGWKRVVGKRK